MAYIGLDGFYIARMNPNTRTVIADPTQGGLVLNSANIPAGSPASGMVQGHPGVFYAGLASAGGATKADITNLEGTITKTYGSNAVARAASGTPEPQVSFSTNNMPFDILNRIVGNTPDGNGGYYKTTGGDIPHVALIVQSNNWDNRPRYVCFYDGTAIIANTNIETNDQSDKIVADELTFSALGIAEAVGQSSTAGQTVQSISGNGVQTKTGNQIKVYHMYDSEATGFSLDAMLNEIFPQASGSSSSSASNK